jgi:hypothetical protein
MSPGAELTEKAAKLRDKLDKEAKAGGYLLNPDQEIVMMLCEGLIANQERYGYMSWPQANRLTILTSFALAIIAMPTWMISGPVSAGCMCRKKWLTAKRRPLPFLSAVPRTPSGKPRKRPRPRLRARAASRSGGARCAAICARGKIRLRNAPSARPRRSGSSRFHSGNPAMISAKAGPRL